MRIENYFRGLALVGLLAAIGYTLDLHLENIKAVKLRLDRLEEALLPVASILEDQPLIGFLYGKKDIQLALQAQFILAPTILERNQVDHDTILLIRNTKKEAIEFSPTTYDTLFYALKGDQEIILYSKTR